MDTICPVCNGLEEHQSFCPRCGSYMKEMGALQDFFGPYSPYQEQDTVNLPVEYQQVCEQACVHLYRCSNCGIEDRVTIKKINI
ncbi:MAG TPA: hypothetical protein GXZ32_08235 [Clostridiales bacterium]|nr:hypothetical protein [Clostridiales bacterium]